MQERDTNKERLHQYLQGFVAAEHRPISIPTPTADIVETTLQKDTHKKKKVKVIQGTIGITLGVCLTALVVYERFIDNDSQNANTSSSTNKTLVEPTPTINFPVAVPASSDGIIYLATPVMMKTSTPTPGPTPFPSNVE